MDIPDDSIKVLDPAKLHMKGADVKYELLQDPFRIDINDFLKKVIKNKINIDDKLPDLPYGNPKELLSDPDRFDYYLGQYTKRVDELLGYVDDENLKNKLRNDFYDLLMNGDPKDYTRAFSKARREVSQHLKDKIKQMESSNVFSFWNNKYSYYLILGVIGLGLFSYYLWKRLRNKCAGLKGKEWKKCQLEIIEANIKKIEEDLKYCKKSNDPKQCERMANKLISNWKERERKIRNLKV